MAAYLSLTHTDAEATPFLLTPPDLIRGGRYLRNNMDLAVHRAIHNPLHSLSCAINDPWGLSIYIHHHDISSRILSPISQPYPLFLYDSRRTSPVARFFDKSKGSAPAFAGALPLRFFSESYSLRWQVPPQCAQSPLHLPFFLLFRTKRRARSAASAISASSR